MKQFLLTFTLLAGFCALAGAADTPELALPANAPDALYKAIQLDNQIKEKKVGIEKDKAKKFALYEAEAKASNDKLNKLKKDEFETTNEFNARIEKLRVDISKTLEDKKSAYMNDVYSVEKEKNLAGLQKQLDLLLGTKFDLTKTYYSYTIGKYNADENYFDVKFSYYMRTDIVDGKKKYVWDNVSLKWEIEREKAKELSTKKAQLAMTVKASVFKLDDQYVLDQYEIAILDPANASPLFSYVLYKERRIRALFTPKLDKANAAKIFVSTIPDLRLRDAEKVGSVIRLLKEGEKVKVIEMGQSDEIDGIKANWIKVKSLANGEEGWCFSGYMTEVK